MSYHTKKIALTLNGETREVDALVPERTEAQHLIVWDVLMSTEKGCKKHSGAIYLRTNDQDVYTEADIVYHYYKGMIGNGYSPRSTIRWVGF
jgi:hypothetical protein